MTTPTNRYVYKEGHLLRQRLGAGRENEISPLRTLMQAGIKVALATDNVPVSMFYPIWQSVARKSLYTGEPIAPQQKLSREDALRAAPLTVDEDAIKDISSDMTVVGGKVVWEKAGA